MKILVLKTPAENQYHVLAVRSDGVLLEIGKGPGDQTLPHELFHYAAESAAEIRFGMWECVDRGGIYKGMRILSNGDLSAFTAASEQIRKELDSALDEAEFLVSALSVTLYLGLEGDADAAQREVQNRWPKLTCPDLHRIDLGRVREFSDRISRAWEDTKDGEWLVCDWPMR